jgi:hypothetical protein
MRERPKYNYHGLLDYLSRGRNKNDRPGDKASLRIQRIGGEPCVNMYSTTIARFHEDGTITINAGGWEDSSTTRQRIGDVAGAWIFTIASHLKRRFVETTRLYVAGMPNGVPYARDCVISRGSVIRHPEMEKQGVTDIRELSESVRGVRKERKEVVEYYAARRALAKKLRPMLHFIDERVLAATPTPRTSLDWLEDVLFNEIEAEDTMGVACALIDLGKPVGGYCGKSQYDAARNGDYVQKGIGSLVGPGSWAYFESAGLIDVESVRCMEA